MTGVWMRFRAELRSLWRAWLTVAVLAGIAGGLVVTAAAGARRTDSALARHLVAFRFPDARVNVNTDSDWKRTFGRIRALPQVEASAVDAELAYCARDANDRSVIDVGPQGVEFAVNVDGREGAALGRWKLLTGRAPDRGRPLEALVDSRAAKRFGVRPGDTIPVRVFPSFGMRADLAIFRCQPKSDRSQYGIPARREVRQILLSCPKPRPCDQAKAVASRFYTRLEKGADFAKLARKYSDDPDAMAHGGRLWIARGQTVAPFDRTAFLLRTGKVSRPLKTRYGWHIVQALSKIVPGGRPLELRVVGVKATTEPAPIGIVWLTPAFDRVYGFDSRYYNYWIAVRLRRGAADVPGFQAGVERLVGAGKLDREQVAADKIQRSIHHEVQALWLAAGFGALLVLVLLAQALARGAALAALEHPTLQAIGMTRLQLFGVGAARAAAIAAFAAVLAVLLAVALSPLTPIGLARELEPQPGFAFDPLAVGVGGTAVFVVVFLVGALASWRAVRVSAADVLRSRSGHVPVADVLARWRVPTTIVTGVRLALTRGAGATAVPVGATLLGGALAVAVVATALTFSASLDHLFSTPRLYGQNWDYRSEYCCEQAPGIVRADPSIGDAALGGDKGNVLLNGRSVGVVAMDDIKGRIAPEVTEGRAPERVGEILLARKTLDALALEVGDTVEVRSTRAARMRIVGRGVVPEGTFNELGKGAALTFGAFKQVEPGARPYVIHIRIAPWADREATLRRLERQFVTPAPGPPTTVADGVRELALAVSILLVGLAAGALAHTLITAVRRRRRDLAILKTLGFDRRQVVAVVIWQATTFAAIALLVGVPLGVACGRWVWNLFAEQIGAVPESVTPLAFILLVVPGTVLLANLVSVIPGLIASRMRPAPVLRAE